MERPIQYINYDKLSDDVLYLGSKTYLRIVVQLSIKKDPDKRYHFHKEYSYYSKYSENGKLNSMRRSFEYFLTIEKTDMGLNGIMIRTQDMILFKKKLWDVSKWFEKDVFVIKKKHLIVLPTEPIVLDGLAGGKYIKFEPIVLKWEDTNKEDTGLRITLGDPSIFIDITPDRFFSLLYTIDTFNMYEAASLLVNYLGRPSFGFNMVELDMMNNYEFKNKQSTLTGAKENREIPKKNKSFFDKLDGMEG